MRIGGDDHASNLRTHIRTPGVGIRQEEALSIGPSIRAFVVQRFPLLFERGFQRIQGEMDSAIVSSVLALGEQTVLLDSGSGVRHFLRVFIRDALAAFVILLAIFGGPPVTQVAVRVEFASLIVEAMNDFMSDDHANGAEINRIVFRRIEIRRLQNNGGENYGGLVWGIDGE